MADQIGNQLIAELSRRVVIEVAPEEHQAFNAISEAYFKNPKKTLKGKRGEDELIGFGIEEIALPLTPIILEVTKETLHHHLKSVTSNRSPTLLERLKELLERLKKSVKRFFGAQFIPLMPLDLLLPLDEEQRKFIHQRVHDRAVQLGVNANKVSLIADSVVANLQVHPLPSLGVPTVDEALDWAWLVDLGQGNFATAYQAAEAALRQGRSVDTLFAWAVVNQLQGNYTEALPAFHEAFIATQDGERKTIVAAMAYLAQRQREGLLPDKVSVLFLELQDWFPRDAAAFTSKQFFESVEQAHVPEVMMAGFFILYILVNAPSNWSSFANFQDNAESKSRYLEYLQSFQAYWQQLTPDILSPAVAVAHAWILAVHQKTDALGWLDQFIVQQEQLVQTLTPKESQKHQPSLGWLWLQRGDLLATSDQLGHPLMFGFRITSSGGDTTVPVNPDLFNFSNLDLPGARIAYQGASQYFAAAEMLRGMAMVESRWGYLDAREGNWEGAEQRYLSACQQFETLGDSIHALAARAGCIWTQIQRNQPQQEILDAAKAWAEVVKSRDALVFGIGYGLAFAYVGRQALATQGDIELALTAAQCAATVFEVLESPWHQAQAHGDCAEALRLINAFESSLAEQEKAIQLMQDFLRDCSDPSRTDEIRATALQQVLALVQLACNVLDVGCLERAKGYAQEFSKGAAGFEQLMIGEIKQSIDRMVDFYLPLIKGQIAIEAGQDEEAAQHFEDAIAHSIGHHDANFLKAMVYAAWRRYDESKAALRQYMAEAPQEIFPGLQMNSFVKMMQRVDPRKVELEQQQADLGKRNSLFTLYVTIRAWEEAQTQLKEIDRLTGASGTLDTVASRDDIQRHADRGLIAEGLGDLKVAQQYLTEAIAALENQRRRLHQDGYRRAFSGQRSVVGTYADLVRVLTDAGNWEGAFLEADKARAQVLAEALGGAKAALRQIKDTSQFRQYAEATAVVERLTTELALAQQLPDTQRLSDLKIKLQKATEIRNDKEQDLAEAEPDWRKLFAPQIEVISVADVAKVLPQNTLLLAYLFAGERLFAWAVSNQGLVGHHSLNQMNGKPFVARPFGNRVQVWVRNQGKADPEVGDELAISLIEPFGELITHASHLVIVPFAELNLVPFAALPWQGQPLGMQKSLSYLPSVSLLQHFRTPASDASGILVVGNPTDMAYEDLKSNEQVSLDPLPMARGGAELVAELYQVKPLIGSAATEEAVREAIKQHPRIIHLFTHGYLQEKVPLASGVALAKHEALTVDEFMGIDLRADVVILSACETGQGKLEGSELNGLARSILYAGARAVVVSLWKANDIANAILMYQLHRELRANKPLAWSLRDAQASLCKVTAQQALDFCRKAQAKIPITPDENLFDHALLTTYMGDILASANDYTHAVEAHRAAMNILSHLSQVNPVPSLLEKIQKDVEEWEFLAEEGYDNFNPDKLLYNSPQYWATFEIIGDWR